MVTASQVKDLREKTGAGMMDCKKVLTETDGDLEKAAELYSKAALEYGGQEIFREMFGKDKETLVRQGISEKDIPLMMDLV